MIDILSKHIDVSKARVPEIRNIVASSNTGIKLNLQQLCMKLYPVNLDVIYEPESFPGLSLKTSNATFNVFQSGKFLILGCTSIAQVEDSERYFLSLITEL